MTPQSLKIRGLSFLHVTEGALGPWTNTGLSREGPASSQMDSGGGGRCSVFSTTVSPFQKSRAVLSISLWAQGYPACPFKPQLGLRLNVQPMINEIYK